MIIRNILEYLLLNKVGCLEIVFAVTLLLSGFSFLGLPLSVLMWVILINVVVVEKKKVVFKGFKPLTIFVIYWALHDVLLMSIADVNLGRFIAQSIYFVAIPLVYPNLNIEKLKGALNWVALVAIAGLLYQWYLISTGDTIHPLEIPGLNMSKDRLETFSIRPSSFFMEPAAYVAFMICPLAFSLIDKKYVWTIVIVLSIFLTTSTTGLVLSFVALGTSLLGERTRVGSWIMVGIMSVGLFYALTHIEAFQVGVEKLENTDNTNVRLAQGQNVVSTMRPSEFVFGAPYGSPYHYCKAGRATDVEYLGENVYMSTFWFMILQYGIIGLILYLLIYFKILKTSRKTWPLLFCLLITLFSDSDNFSINFCYRLIILLVILENAKNTNNQLTKRFYK